MGNDRRLTGALLLFVGGITYQVSYTGLAIVLPLAGRELEATPMGLGLILAGFPLGLALFSVPAGAIAHRFSARTTIQLGLAVLGGAGLLSAASTSPYELVGFRVAAGAGASLFWVPAVGLLSQYYLAQHRAVVIGLFVTCGIALGGTIGLVGGEILGAAFGWRFVLIAGAMGAVVVGLVCTAALPGDPARSVPDEAVLTRQAVGATLRSRSTWGLALGLVGASSAAFVAIGFVSSYFLAEHPSWGLAGAATVAAAGFLLSVPGGVAGGWLSERGADRRWVGAAFVAPFGALFFLIPFASEYVLVGLYAMLGFLYGGILAIWFTMPSHLTGEDRRRVSVDVGLINTTHLFANAGFAVAFAIVVARSGYPLAWEAFALLAWLALPALLLITPNRATSSATG